LPAAIATTSDPIDIAARAVAISPSVAARLDAELTSIEVTAASTARPAAYVHEALVACRDSGRTPAVISRSSAQAVSSYLDKHGLADQTRNATAIASFPPGHLQTFPHLLEDAIHALGATPADCALITATEAGIDAANGIGTYSIGYATTPATSERLNARRMRSASPTIDPPATPQDPAPARKRRRVVRLSVASCAVMANTEASVYRVAKPR
jgi:beta-phosphoglucomutase-like phosphatase (HAD superfamily)